MAVAAPLRALGSEDVRTQTSEQRTKPRTRAIHDIYEWACRFGKNRGQVKTLHLVEHGMIMSLDME